MVGIAQKNAISNGGIHDHNYSKCGWFIWTERGTIFSQSGHSHSPYYNQAINVGDVIGLEWTKNGDIYYFLNGKDLGVAFTNVVGDYYPAFEMYHDRTSIEFVKPNW